MRKTLLFIGFTGIMFLLSSCYYDVEEELYGNQPCDTSDVNYTNSVRPILENNCLVCHSGGTPSAGIDLDSHGNVLVFVNNGKLLSTIQHELGVSPMPKNADKLSDCEIDQIRIWIEAGAPNN